MATSDRITAHTVKHLDHIAHYSPTQMKVAFSVPFKHAAEPSPDQRAPDPQQDRREDRHDPSARFPARHQEMGHHATANAKRIHYVPLPVRLR